MNEIECTVHKYVISFCKALPCHLEKWQKVIKEHANTVKGIVNQSEQLCYVQVANIPYMDNFNEAKNILKANIIQNIEEDYLIIKNAVNELYKVNQDLRNKLILLENASVSLDWDSNSVLVRGNATMPSMERLLQGALEYSNHFQTIYRNISNCTRNINWFDKVSINDFENAFMVDLNDTSLTYFIALTQFVQNEKSVV